MDHHEKPEAAAQTKENEAFLVFRVVRQGLYLHLPQDFGAAYNCLRRRSYSPWGPTKNQIIVSAFSIPTARQSRSTLVEKIGSVAWTFLNLSEGC
jgi:hypothetical protein